MKMEINAVITKIKVLLSSMFCVPSSQCRWRSERNVAKVQVGASDPLCCRFLPITAPGRDPCPSRCPREKVVPRELAQQEAVESKS